MVTLVSLKGDYRMDLLSVSALQALLNLHGNVEVDIMISFIILGCQALQKNEGQAKFTGSIIIIVFLIFANDNSASKWYVKSITAPLSNGG